MAAFERFANLMLSHLLWTSLQAAVLVVILALVLRLLPRLPAAARCALWWLVALQVVLGLSWQSPVRVPLLSPPVPITMQMEHHAVPANSSAETGATVVPSPRRGWDQRISWREGLLALWVLAVLAQVPALVAQRRRLRALLRDSQPVDLPLQERCADMARAAGLRRCPRMHMSRGVAAPLVAGGWRPIILWPDRQTLSADETSLALAHELAHLKRGDLFLGVMPALARRLLFFHPLVRWAMREYAAYREAACDAAVVRERENDAQSYGVLLLRLGVSGAHLAGISAASETFRNLKLRLTMLRQPADAMLRARVWILIVAVAMLGTLPYRVVAANGPATVQAKTGAGHPNGVVEPTARCEVKAEDKVRADNIPFCGADFLMYRGSAQSGRSAVLFDKGDVIIAGDHADVVAAKRFYRPGARLLWFRRDGREYVARDGSTLRGAEALVLPVVRKEGVLLDRKQKLLEQQSKLLEMQSALIDRQRKLAALRAGMSGTSRGRAKADQRAKLETRIQAQQAQIEAMRSSLHRQQLDLQKMEQAASDKSRGISDGLKKLAANALASGKAEPIDR